MQIAEAIGHPYKVVQVWFRNSRAKDRREGKLGAGISGAVKYLTHPATLQHQLTTTLLIKPTGLKNYEYFYFQTYVRINALNATRLSNTSTT